MLYASQWLFPWFLWRRVSGQRGVKTGRYRLSKWTLNAGYTKANPPFAARRVPRG